MSLKTNPVSSGYSTVVINSNFKKIEEYVNDNLLNRDGVTPGEPNQMEVDLDMNSQDILNVGNVSAKEVFIGGTSVKRLLNDSHIAAGEEADRARGEADRAKQEADRAGRVVGDVVDALDGKVDKVAGMGLSSNNFTDPLRDKLIGIADGATANSTDAYLLNRDNHTGTQPINTVTGLTAELSGKVGTTDPRLSDPRTPTGTAGGVLSGTYPNPTFAVDMATQSELDAVAVAKMDVGTGGWLGRALPNSYISGYPQDMSQNVSQIYRRDSVDEGVSAFASSIHFAANDTWGRLRVGHNNQRAWIQGGTDQTGTGWTAELYHTGNTTVDGNGFIKQASPIIKLYSDTRDSEFVRVSTGVYELTGCNGLRLSDGWYIETPHDRNGNKYFNVEWYQDVEPATDKGVLDEAADVALSIHCYERVWNPLTGTWDNGEPVDIPEGRWIDLRMNEVRQPELDIPEEGT